MTYELAPVVQAVLDIYPEKRKDGFDHFMDFANLIANSLSGVYGVVNASISGILQTCALMQGRYELRKIVEYTSSLEEARIKSAVEFERLELKKQHQWQQYDLQKSVLKLYVDKQYQKTIDEMLKSFQHVSQNIDKTKFKIIREIDEYTSNYIRGMEHKYKAIIREQELVYAAYKDQLEELSKSGIDRIKLASSIADKVICNIDKFDDKKFSIVFDSIIRLTEPYEINFEGFTKIRNSVIKFDKS